MQNLAAQAAKLAGAGGDPQAAASAAKCAATFQKFIVPLQKATIGLATRAQAAARVIAILLLLFVVHQLFFWIDEKPEIAFDQAALAFGVVETTWDTTGIVYNAAVDIVNSGVVPLWNAGVYYTIEPTLTLLVEVFSIVFLLQPWPGLIGDEFYFGFDCLANDEAFAWCGRFGHYAAELESPENAPQFVAQSQAYGKRTLYEVLERNDTYTFGLATARRLAELADGDVATPSFSTRMLTRALDMLTNFVLSIAPPIFDMFFAITQEIVITSFTVLVDVAKTVIVQAFEVVKMLFKSGIIVTLINVGLDFLVIGFTELALPLLFAGIDALMCVLDFFAPSGWNDQLECVERSCFKGPSITSDLMVFTAVPVVIGRFTAIMDATLNSRSGKKFVQGFSGSFTSEGKTRNVQTGQQINVEDPEGANAGSPVNHFTFAEDFDDFLFTAGAQECRACFVCKASSERPPRFCLFSRVTRAPLSRCGRCPSCASCGCSSRASAASSRARASTPSWAT